MNWFKSVSLRKEPSSTFSWKISGNLLRSFKHANNGQCFFSPEFEAYGAKWKLKIYPKGIDEQSDGYFSWFLDLQSLPLSVSKLIFFRTFNSPEIKHEFQKYLQHKQKIEQKDEQKDEKPQQPQTKQIKQKKLHCFEKYHCTFTAENTINGHKNCFHHRFLSSTIANHHKITLKCNINNVIIHKKYQRSNIYWKIDGRLFKSIVEHNAQNTNNPSSANYDKYFKSPFFTLCGKQWYLALSNVMKDNYIGVYLHIKDNVKYPTAIKCKLDCNELQFSHNLEYIYEEDDDSYGLQNAILKSALNELYVNKHKCVKPSSPNKSQVTPAAKTYSSHFSSAIYIYPEICICCKISEDQSKLKWLKSLEMEMNSKNNLICKLRQELNEKNECLFEMKNMVMDNERKYKNAYFCKTLDGCISMENINEDDCKNNDDKMLDEMKDILNKWNIISQTLNSFLSHSKIIEMKSSVVDDDQKYSNDVNDVSGIQSLVVQQKCNLKNALNMHLSLLENQEILKVLFFLSCVCAQGA